MELQSRYTQTQRLKNESSIQEYNILIYIYKKKTESNQWADKFTMFTTSLTYMQTQAIGKNEKKNKQIQLSILYKVLNLNDLCIHV